MIVQDRTRKSVLTKSSKYLKSINKLHKEYNYFVKVDLLKPIQICTGTLKEYEVFGTYRTTTEMLVALNTINKLLIIISKDFENK